MIIQLAFGLLLSTAIGLVGYWRASLSWSGVAGALITGTLIFGLGGLIPGILLVAFFVSSSFLSHYHAKIKERLADKFQKGSRRDLGQALANGGWAAVIAVLLALFPAGVLFLALVGALATVTADTWATELGVLSSHPPRLITSGRRVAVGTSGGVTLLGTIVSLLGALFIGLVAAVSVFLGMVIAAKGSLQPLALFFLIVIAGVSGLLGSLFDSLLGATVQAIYYCDRCGVETERRVHTCGLPTLRIRGLAWMNNDLVNFLASVAGSVFAALLAMAVAEAWVVTFTIW